MKGSVRSSLCSPFPDHQYTPSDSKLCPDLLMSWVPAPSFCFLALPAAGFVTDLPLLTTGFALVSLSTPGLPACGVQWSTAMCSHFKGFCFPPSQPASQLGCVRPPSKPPTSCLALCPPNSSCSFPVVLLAEGMLVCVCVGGGGSFPLACLLSITSAYSQIPLGSGKGGFFINFFFQWK